MRLALAGWLSWLERCPCTPKGCRFNYRSGHKPYTVGSTPGRGVYGRQLIDASLFLKLIKTKTNMWVRIKKKEPKGLNALLKHTHAHTPYRVTAKLTSQIASLCYFYCLKMTKLLYAHIHTVFSTGLEIP